MAGASAPAYLTKEVTMGYKVWPLIDDALIASESRTPKVSKIPSVWPSEASAVAKQNGESNILGKCHRASYLRMIGWEVTNSVDAPGAWRWVTGRKIEDHLTELAKHAKIFVANGVRTIVRDLYLPLEMDLITIDPETNEGWIIECKTYYGYMAKKEIETNRQPKTSNLIKVCLYLNEFKTGKKLKEVIAESIEQKKSGLDIRNRIEIDPETLARLDDGPLRAKLVYISRDECLRKEFDITIQEDFDGMHYPVVDGIMYRQFTIESMYQRYQVLQSYWFEARTEAVRRLEEKGIKKPETLSLVLKAGDPIDNSPLSEADQEYLQKLDREVKLLPDSYWPPAEYEWSYSPEKVEKLYSIGEIGKIKYQDYKKRKPGKDRIGSFHCGYCSYKRVCVPKQGSGAYGQMFDLNHLDFPDE